MKFNLNTMLITDYINRALELAEYSKDENGFIVAEVPNASGFFSQGETYEEARENLKDAIEGNIIIALQMGLDVPIFGDIKFTTKSQALLNV